MSEPAAEGPFFDLSSRPEPIGQLLRQVWESRALIAILARQNFFVQYRRASFGLLWALAIPVLQASVLALVVQRVIVFPGLDPYFVFVLASITGWSYFASTLASGSTAIVDAAGLSTKIYLPRIVFPLVGVATSTYGLLLTTVLLVLASLGFGVPPSLDLLWLLPALALLILLTAGFVCTLSALHVYFRDIRYVVHAALLAWFYLTPGFYPLDRIGKWQWIIELNPMTGVLEMFHAATVGASADWPRTVGWTVAWCIGLTISALLLHRRYDRVLSDLL